MFKKGISAFTVVNTVAMGFLGLICVIPFLNTLAISLSSSLAVSSGRVFIFPVDFDLTSYKFVIERQQFWRSASISVIRVVLGVSIQMVLMVLTAYPLSREKEDFTGRTVIVWYFFLTSIFSGGLIPQYIVVSELKLVNTIWALVVPGAVNVGNIILLLNFFRRLPRELYDATLIDGASHWRVLFNIYVPLSLPALSTMLLFSFVGHWNAWFDGMIYMSRQDMYPLQTFIRNVSIKIDLENMTLEELEEYMRTSDRTLRCAQVFVAALPIMLLYPFLQRYFVKGLVLGSVKG